MLGYYWSESKATDDRRAPRPTKPFRYFLASVARPNRMHRKCERWLSN